MRNARFSLLVWSIYVLVVGVSLALVPKQFTQVFGIDEPLEVWIRVAGVVVVVLGVYYLGAVLNSSEWMYRYSVFGRLVAVVGIGYLAIVDGPWQLWIFVVLDALGLLWTYNALRPRPEPVPDPTTEPAG